MSVIKFHNVGVIYPNGFAAVRGAGFAIAAGECLAIVGASGSGKTTIARAALGLLPDETKITGSILFGEIEIVGASEKTLRGLRGLQIGFVGQNPFAACNPLATIFDHLSEAWRIHSQMPPREKIVESLENSGIKNAAIGARQFPHQWSGGMLQRAEIAAAAAHQPRLIIADEPTSALDQNRADAILAALRLTGAAVLLISHDLKLVARHADRIAVCCAGEIVEINDAAEILKNPQHFYTKKLLKIANEKQTDFPAANGKTVLRAANISKIYGRGANGVCAVSKANLTVERGEIVGIYGASGSGKSTLLRMLATIETPTSGRVFFGNESKMRGGAVMPIFQDSLSSLDSRWAIWRSVTEPLTAKHHKKRFSKSERCKIAQRILAEVGLGEIDLDAQPRQLSVGQCQRICIARAFVAEPQIILADEPTSALDAAIAAEIVRLFAAAARRGIAVVVVSHDEKMLKTLCHRVLEMRGGELENQQIK